MKQSLFNSSRRMLVCISSVVTAILLYICLELLPSIDPPVHGQPLLVARTSSSVCVRPAQRHIWFVLHCWKIGSQVNQTRLSQSEVSPQVAFLHIFQLRMTSRADQLAHQQQREQGIGTNKHAVKFSGQDYETLQEECLRRGILFEDNCFPAGSRSLGYKELGPYSAKTRGVVWKRPKVKIHYVNTHVPLPACV